jgi:hypothetical protein
VFATDIEFDHPLLLEWSVERGLVKRDGCWWSERRSSNESKVQKVRDLDTFNRSFEPMFKHDYDGKPKRPTKLVLSFTDRRNSTFFLPTIRTCNIHISLSFLLCISKNTDRYFVTHNHRERQNQHHHGTNHHF